MVEEVESSRNKGSLVSLLYFCFFYNLFFIQESRRQNLVCAGIEYLSEYQCNFLLHVSLLQFFGFFLVSPVNDDDNDIDMDVLEISSDEDDNSMLFVNHT